MKKNIIRITGEINDEAFTSFDRKLTTLENKNEEDKVIVQIISEGGDAYAALAFFDRIKASTLHVSTVATGLVASAASIIFMAGGKRYMTSNAWLMVHEDTVSGIDDMKVTQIEKEVTHGRRMEHQWCELMASVSDVTTEEWSQLHKNETYLNANECLEMGVIEAII